MGLAMLPTFLARTDDGLIEVPGADRPLLGEIWCVVHPDVRSPGVRLMVI
jgi:DNA-binding transcriptional LysR family regulator